MVIRVMVPAMILASLGLLSHGFIFPPVRQGQGGRPLQSTRDQTPTAMTAVRPKDNSKGVKITHVKRIRSSSSRSTVIDRRGMFKTASAMSLGLVLASRMELPSLSSSSAADAATPSLRPPLVSELEVLSTTLTVADTGTTINGTPSSPLQDFISGLAGGAASRASKELLLHPIDTWKTRLQYAKGDEEPAELFRNLYDGVWPALVVGTPAGAAFFATKDVLKGLAKTTFGSKYRILTTIGAVFIANFPYWLIRNPAEVLKTQQQTGLVDSSTAGVIEAVKEEGLGGLYRGYASNIAYAFPTDAIKFVVYEALQNQFTRKLNPLESSALGSAASSVAQLMSTPLDVVRTRIMTDCKSTGEADVPTASVWKTARTIAAEEGVGKLFSGLVPRLTRAFLSGAIQFGSYELTKGAFSNAGKK
ncbi:hypothetical protein VYU27_004802 [Nannochloropsis oceanica]